MVSAAKAAAEEVAQLAREIRTITRAVVMFLSVGVALLGLSQGWRSWPLPVLFALGLFLAGVLVGFLFGIPKVASNPNASPAESGAYDQAARRRLNPNTNLEQISDWLTKIIVGLGLVNLGKIGPLVTRFCVVISPAFHFWTSVAPLAVTIYFPVLGFTSGYLITRLYLSGLFHRADTQLDHLREQTIEEASALQEVISQKASASAGAVDLSTLKTDALLQSDKILREKPESQYSHKDWSVRAFAAYAEKKPALAAEYFGRAAQAAAQTRDATPKEAARYTLNRGTLLEEIGEPQKAIEAFDEVIRRFKGASDPELREAVANAMFNKAGSLAAERRYEEAIQVYDEMIERYTEPEMRSRVTAAMINEAGVLAKLGRTEAALKFADELFTRYKDVEDPATQLQLISALINKGETLGNSGEWKMALSVFDEILARCKDSPNPLIGSMLVQVLMDKAVTLGRLGQRSQAETILTALISKQSDSGVKPVDELIAKAREYLRLPEESWQYPDVGWEMPASE